METYGSIRIKLDELIKKSGISKNKLSHRAEMQRSQINNYCSGKVTRLDIDVLARICTVFNCKISDLLEFVPTEEKNFCRKSVLKIQNLSYKQSRPFGRGFLYFKAIYLPTENKNNLLQTFTPVAFCDIL